MKSKLYLFLLLSAITLFLTRPASAQVLYGYTTVEWDDSTQTVYGYSETDLDEYAAYFYTAKVSADLRDPNGSILDSKDAEGTPDQNDEADVTLSAPGQNDTTYTVNGYHRASINYSYTENPCDPSFGPGLRCPSDTYYDDYYYYEYFDNLFGYGGFYNSSDSWFGPGPDNLNRRRPILDIGATNDSAAIRTPAACGDSRDDLIQEYRDLRITIFKPTCTQITHGVSTEYFTFNQLNYPSPKTAPAEFPDIAVLSWEGIGMVNAWYSKTSFPINSGYRDPVQNKDALGVANSRHQLGYAFDAGTRDYNWQTLRNSIVNLYGTKVWIEPIDGPCGTACVHADTRKTDKNSNTNTYIYP